MFTDFNYHIINHHLYSFSCTWKNWKQSRVQKRKQKQHVVIQQQYNIGIQATLVGGECSHHYTIILPYPCYPKIIVTVIQFVDSNNTTKKVTSQCIIDGKLPYLANQPQNLRMQLGFQIQVSFCKENTAHSLRTILVQAKKTQCLQQTYKETLFSCCLPNQALSTFV